MLRVCAGVRAHVFVLSETTPLLRVILTRPTQSSARRVYSIMSTYCTFAYRRVPTPRQEHTLLMYFEIRRPNRRLEPTNRHRTGLEQGVTPPRSLLPLAHLVDFASFLYAGGAYRCVQPTLHRILSPPVSEVYNTPCPRSTRVLLLFPPPLELLPCHIISPAPFTRLDSLLGKLSARPSFYSPLQAPFSPETDSSDVSGLSGRACRSARPATFCTYYCI